MHFSFSTIVDKAGVQEALDLAMKAGVPSRAVALIGHIVHDIPDGWECEIDTKGEIAIGGREPSAVSITVTPRKKG